ncbi:MAG: hypothetical protein QW763_06875 [Archaeoglobaceae archaeon]
MISLGIPGMIPGSNTTSKKVIPISESNTNFIIKRSVVFPVKTVEIENSITYLSVLLIPAVLPTVIPVLLVFPKVTLLPFLISVFP